MSKRDVLLAILNSSELNSLPNNAKIRSSLKFLLTLYMNKDLSNDPFCIGTSNFFDIATGGYSETCLIGHLCYPFYCVIRH